MDKRVHFRKQGRGSLEGIMKNKDTVALILLAAYYFGLVAGSFLVFRPGFSAFFASYAKAYIARLVTGGFLWGLGLLLWTAFLPLGLILFLSFSCISGPVLPGVVCLWGGWGGMWAAYLYAAHGFAGALAYLVGFWPCLCICAAVLLWCLPKAAEHSALLWNLAFSRRIIGVNTDSFTAEKTKNLLRQGAAGAAICFGVCLFQFFVFRAFAGLFRTLL